MTLVCETLLQYRNLWLYLIWNILNCWFETSCCILRVLLHTYIHSILRAYLEMLNLRSFSGNHITGARSVELEFLELLISQDADLIFNQHTCLSEGEEDRITYFPVWDEGTRQEIHELYRRARKKLFYIFYMICFKQKYFVRKFKSFL